MTPAVGGRLGHFEILAPLGAGGMGVVYRARDTRLGRDVALKILPEAFARDPGRLSRFEREARVLATLSHPGIAVIYGLEPGENGPALVMELVEGEGLDKRLARGRIPVREALEFARQMAAALESAHAKGIIHRDLKPSNIRLTPEGQAKLLDFGLAKALATGDEREGATQSVDGSTATGVVVGTAPYMSPEQARGEATDRRTDVWSFGCVLYEMLAGGRAFPGHTAEAVAAVLERQPEWGALPEETPAKVVQLLHRCLQKDRNRRLHDVADARIELDEALAEPAPPAARAGSSPGRLSRGRRWGALAAGLLLVAGLAALAFYWGRPTDEAPRVGGSEPVPLTAYEGRETEPAFSPDGNQVAFVWDGPRQDNADIYVKLIGTEEPLRLTRDPAPDVSPAWSPDGRSIAFLRLGPDEVEEERRSSALVLVPAIGGAERRVAEVGAGSIRSTVAYRYWTADALPLVAWTPDGRWLIVADWESAGQPLGLFAFSLESGERRRLTSPPARRDSAPAVSPDGRTLVFARSFAPGVSELQRLAFSPDLAPSGDPRPLTSLRQWSTSPSWLPDGREIVFSSGNWALGRHDLWRVPAFGGTPSRLPFTGQDASGPAVSRQGRRLAFARPIARENLFRLELEGGKIVSEPAPWAPSTRVDQNPKYSADGRRVAFLSSRSGSLEVWIAGADGGDLRQLTQMGAPVTGGVGWSPDGRFLVFCSTREGNWELYAVAVAGGSPRRLTSHPAADALPSFSADGRFVYFVSTRGGEADPTTGITAFDVWKMPWRPPGEPAAPVRVTTGGGRFGFETPDGRLLYYVPQASVAQPGTLFRVGVESGEPRRIAGPVSFLNLSVNAEGAYFMTPVEGGRSRLNFCDHRTLSVRELGTIEGRVGTGLSVSPDGRTLLFARVGEMGGDLMLVEGFR